MAYNHTTSYHRPPIRLRCVYLCWCFVFFTSMFVSVYICVNLWFQFLYVCFASTLCVSPHEVRLFSFCLSSCVYLCSTHFVWLLLFCSSFCVHLCSPVVYIHSFFVLLLTVGWLYELRWTLRVATVVSFHSSFVGHFVRIFNRDF